MPATIVLASGSPRRHEMLTRLGLEYRVAVPDVDETPRAGEDPARYVERLARDKVGAVAAFPESLVIGADTTVEVDGDILGKPADEAEARRMLRRLSGRTHHVHTAVAVRRHERTISAVADTLVQFEPLSATAVEWYLATGEPYDRAGAYALQGAAGVFVTSVTGSVSNVVGLPLTLLVRLARQVGVDLLAPPGD
jgi:septum formation protein